MKFARKALALALALMLMLALAAFPAAQADSVLKSRHGAFAAEALGRICGAPTVSCPPAIPVVVSGERIGPEAMELFAHYGVKTVDVLK